MCQNRTKIPNTKETIINNAKQIFLEKGYNNTLLLDIAKKCGLTRGGIYHYFKNKEDLFLEVMNKILDENETLFLLLLDKDVSFKELLYDLCLLCIEFGKNCTVETKDSKIFFKHFSELLETKKELSDRTKKMYENILKKLNMKIKEAQLSGEIKNHLDSKELAVQISIIFEGATYSSYYLNLDYEKTVITSFNLFWEFIKA
ncbi:transcriptional regulator, TetR family [Methanococcus vannielii SB]|uniref:Transcriptional regulator, TetR family n=1 Tax=Methanococcus vannielii (strain ATCC 35089 / DSM 1224 / JCM 13029 / OCM 148 / SB) TaxID=406327 RepID=A6UNW9_METVS|nr:TetR/AcrR family transcriptional regulator [Methanococcus vannielii]ABR54191.1 transcriptional regulator, TetR family [Methanococcus vannielii SB]